MFQNRLSSFALIAVVSYALIGCGSSVITGQVPLRTFNALVPAPGSDGSLTVKSGASTITGTVPVATGQFANGGGYFTISGGTFAPIGTSPALTTPLTFGMPPNLQGDGSAWLLAAAGQAGQTGSLKPSLFLIPNYTAAALTIPSLNAAIRVVNLSANLNPVGLFSITGDVPTAPIKVSLGNVAFGYVASANLYTAVPVTQLTSMAIVDSTNTAARLSLATSNNLNSYTFVAGRAYTLYVYGQSANSLQPLNASWVLDFPAQ